MNNDMINDSGIVNDNLMKSSDIEHAVVNDDEQIEENDNDLVDPLQVNLPKILKRSNNTPTDEEPPAKSGTSRSLPKIGAFESCETWERFAKWKKWKCLLLYSLSFAQGWSDDMKIAHTLLAGGNELRDIVQTYRLAPTVGSNDALKTFFGNVEKHFGELTDKSAAYSNITKCRQSTGESTDKFYRRLKECAEVANVDDELVRAHFIANMINKDIAQQADIEDWNIQRIIKTASRVESSRNGSEMGNPLSVAAVEARNAQAPRQPWQDRGRQNQGGRERRMSRPASLPNPCAQCGNTEHRSGTCPAIGKRCINCNKEGHFKRVCRGGRSINVTRNAQVNNVVDDGWGDE